MSRLLRFLCKQFIIDLLNVYKQADHHLLQIFNNGIRSIPKYSRRHVTTWGAVPKRRKRDDDDDSVLDRPLLAYIYVSSGSIRY